MDVNCNSNTFTLKEIWFCIPSMRCRYFTHFYFLFWKLTPVVTLRNSTLTLISPSFATSVLINVFRHSFFFLLILGVTALLLYCLAEYTNHVWHDYWKTLREPSFQFNAKFLRNCSSVKFFFFEFYSVTISYSMTS